MWQTKLVLSFGYLDGDMQQRAGNADLKFRRSWDIFTYLYLKITYKILNAEMKNHSELEVRKVNFW